MLNFLGKRVLQLIPTLFFVSILIFSLQQLLPGDPALVMAGEERDPEVIAQIRAQYRLDQPVPVQYVYWIKGVLSGDFGESLRIKVPVRALIAQKLPVTMQLASMAIVIAFLIGIPAGIVSAVKKGTAWDYSAWANADADKALDDARLVTDMTQRKALYEKLTRLELDEEAILYIYHRRILIAHTNKLEGYQQMPDGLVRVVGLRLK